MIDGAGPPDPKATVEPDPQPAPRDESRCEICGFPLAIERHCKIICPNCGFTRDCSDP